MHIEVIERFDSVSLVVSSGPVNQRIDFNIDTWRSDDIESLIRASERKERVGFYVNPRLRLYAAEQDKVWHLGARTEGGFSGFIEFTEELKARLREIDKRIASKLGVKQVW